jgi:hypothetical protein
MKPRTKNGRLSSVPSEPHAVPIGDLIDVCQDKLIHRVATWGETSRNTFGAGSCAKPELKATTVCGLTTSRVRFPRSINGERCPFCWPNYFDQVPKRGPSLRVIRGYSNKDIPF